MRFDLLVMRMSAQCRPTLFRFYRVLEVNPSALRLLSSSFLQEHFPSHCRTEKCTTILRRFLFPDLHPSSASPFWPFSFLFFSFFLISIHLYYHWALPDGLTYEGYDHRRLERNEQLTTVLEDVYRGLVWNEHDTDGYDVCARRASPNVGSMVWKRTRWVEGHFGIFVAYERSVATT